MTNTPDARAVGHGLGEFRSSEFWRFVAISLVRSMAQVTVIAVAYHVLPVSSSQPGGIGIRALVAAVAIAAVVVWQLRGIQLSKYPIVRGFEALTVAVSFMVCVFATAFLCLSARDVNAFSEPLEPTGALYFTMTTLTTTGYGDIYARTDGARIAVMVQMLFNVVVIGAVIKLILSAARQRVQSVHAG